MARPMVTVGVCFLTAGLAASFLSPNWMIVLCFLLLVSCLPAFFVGRRKKKWLCLLMLASMAAGVFLQLGSALSHSFDFGEIAGEKALIQARVRDRRFSGKRMVYTLQVTGNSFPDAPSRFSALLYAPAETAADFGDQIEVECRMLELSSTPSFDMEGYYRSIGIDAALWAYEMPRIQPAAKRTLTEGLAAFREQLGERVDTLYPAPYHGLIRAVLLGDSTLLDETVEGDFQTAGILHIVAVSGLHVSLIAGALYALLRKIRVPMPWPAVFSCLAAWGFVLLTGANPPAVRAGIMTTVLLASTLFHRPPDSLNSLFAAGTLIVFFFPEAIQGASFQLSFTATLGILSLAPALREWLTYHLHIHSRFPRAVVSLLTLTAGCNLTMLPVVWRWFGGISLVAPLSNLLAVPLMTPILILAALSLIIPPLGGWIAALLIPLLDLLISGSRALAQIPYAYLGLSYPFVGWWCLFAYLLIGGLWLLIRRGKPAAVLSIASLISLALLLGVQALVQWNLVTVLTVESFSASGVLFLHREEATVILTADDGRIGVEIRDTLRNRNIRRIDRLILLAGQTQEVRDEQLLVETFPVDTLLVRDGNGILPYINELFGGQVGEVAACSGPEQEWIDRTGTKWILTGYSQGTALLAQWGDIRLLLTDDPRAAKEINCEILFFHGNFLDLTEQVEAKYVILLNECDIPKQNEANRLFSANQTAIELLLSPEGKLRIRCD